jgi:hypothetical protein
VGGTKDETARTLRLRGEWGNPHSNPPSLFHPCQPYPLFAFFFSHKNEVWSKTRPGSGPFISRQLSVILRKSICGRCSNLIRLIDPSISHPSEYHCDSSSLLCLSSFSPFSSVSVVVIHYHFVCSLLCVGISVNLR